MTIIIIVLNIVFSVRILNEECTKLLFQLRHKSGRSLHLDGLDAEADGGAGPDRRGRVRVAHPTPELLRSRSKLSTVHRRSRFAQPRGHREISSQSVGSSRRHMNEIYLSRT